MRAKAREFDGSGSWREYRSHFERVCRINGWTQDKLDYLWVNLSSTALAYAENLPERRTRTYEALAESLEERFGESRRADVYKAELRSRRRKEGESLPAMGQEVRKLVHHAYPGMGMKGVEELTIERFKEALDDADQRMSVHQAHPRNLEEAIQVAMDLEAWQLSEQRRGASERNVKFRGAKEEESEDSPVGKMLEKMDSILTMLTQRNKTFDTERRDVRCFNCGKLGHYAKNCFSKDRRNKENEGEQEN
jgi:hypothetical protein